MKLIEFDAASCRKYFVGDNEVDPLIPYFIGARYQHKHDAKIISELLGIIEMQRNAIGEVNKDYFIYDDCGEQEKDWIFSRKILSETESKLKHLIKGCEMNFNKVFLKTFGISCEDLRKYHDRDLCYGFNFQVDKIVKLGFVIYFHNKVLGIWCLR